MRRPRILILNGSHSDVPLIRAAKNLDLEVITTGNRPELVGHALADRYENADFSDADAILKLAQRESIDFICPCAHDLSVLTCARVAATLGLPGHDTELSAATIHHKDRFKHFARRIGLPTPRAKDFTSIEAALTATPTSYPVIVKPIDMGGGKGITRVNAPGPYPEAVADAFRHSPHSRIVVETFVTGSLHSYSAFLRAGEVIADFNDDEFASVNPYTVSTSTAPGAPGAQVLPALREWAVKIAAELALVDGVLHFQYLFHDGRFQVVEITRRCSGDLHPIPVSLALGVDWAEWLVRAAIGDTAALVPPGPQRGLVGRHCIMAQQNGRVLGYHLDPALAGNVVERIHAVQPGEMVTDFMTQKLAVLVLQFESEQEMRDKTTRIQQLARVEIEQRAAIAPPVHANRQ